MFHIRYNAKEITVFPWSEFKSYTVTEGQRILVLGNETIFPSKPLTMNDFREAQKGKTVYVQVKDG